MNLKTIAAALLTLMIGITLPARAAITLGGESLALKSSGVASADHGWTLSANGYVGTFVHLSRAGEVTVSLSANGANGPRGNIVINDTRFPFEAAEKSATFDHKTALPPGTHFIRIEYTSHPNNPEQSLTIEKLAINGAEIRNEHSDANALAASETYIAHFRKRPIRLKVATFPPGTKVRVRLARKAFNFGANIPGASNKYLIDNPEAGSDAAKFQKFVVDHFNIVVPSNAGKWSLNEPSPGNLTMEYPDRIMSFAKVNGLRARMHTLIWDTEQQPEWARPMIDAAANGDEIAKKELRAAISRRIQYYVKDRAQNYIELDVLNESVHRPGYVKAFGIAGIADIYNETAKAAHDVNVNVRLYLNEYNVFQWSQEPPFKEGAARDPYANWYRAHVEEVLAAGGAVDGIGVQYYCSFAPPAVAHVPHSPARIFAALQNLSIPGLPITVSEFAVGKDATAEQAVQVYDDMLKLTYGTPQATSFLLWGFWAGAVAPNDIRTALVDETWNLTPAGHRFEKLMAEWSTDESATVGADGTVHLTGFAGIYEVTSDEVTGARPLMVPSLAE